MVHGKSGHAAFPHTTVDPIVAASLLVAQLQTVVSREVPPTMPVVVTVGCIQGGTTYNIIPDSCAIKGTVRTLHPQARDAAEAAIKRLSAGMREGLRVACEVDYRRGVPMLRNDDKVLDPTVAAVRHQFGDDAVEQGEASLGGEDFALMADLVPSFQLRVGSSQPGRDDKLHNSAYQPDERCIGYGVQACNVNGKWGIFSELEYHVPAIGVPGAPQRSEDFAQVWAYRGNREQIARIAKELLGIAK